MINSDSTEEKAPQVVETEIQETEVKPSFEPKKESKRARLERLALEKGYRDYNEMYNKFLDGWGSDSNIDMDENGIYTYEGADITDDEKDILEEFNAIRREELEAEEAKSNEREEMAKELSNLINR